MTMPDQKPDVVDRALADLMGTPGAERPHVEVTERVLSAIRNRQTAVRQRSTDQRPFRKQVAWLPLSACVLVMVTGSWIVAFHAAIWSQVAGQRVKSDGTVWVHYTDGRVVPDSNT
jgi:hypothetical protein